MAAFEEEVLIKEYLRLCTEIRTLETKTDTHMLVGLIVVSVGTIVNEQAWVAGEALPFLLILALLMIWAMVLMAYASIFSLAGYKRHLEEELNRHTGKEHLVWERLVPERQKRNRAAWLSSAVTLLLTLSLLWFNLASLGEGDLGALARIIIAVYAALYLVALAGTAKIFRDTRDRVRGYAGK